MKWSPRAAASVANALERRNKFGKAGRDLWVYGTVPWGGLSELLGLEELRLGSPVLGTNRVTQFNQGLSDR